MTIRKLSLAVLLAGTVSASAQHYSFTNSTSASVPDANPNGIFSTIDVSGIPGTITDVTLSVNISGGYNGDLYAYLSGDNGGFSVLLNRVGRTDSDPTGYSDPGMDILFSDSAAGDVHLYGGNSGAPLTGTWQPDARNTDPQLALDTDPRTAPLSSFDNRNPNGTWVLFLGDFANESQSTLVSWTLNIDAVPEPSSASLLMIGLAIFWAMRRRVSRGP
jgi:subtilisin-like proprotein convertase family protein